MFYLGARADKYLDNGVLVTMEGGYAEEEGGIYQIGGDRTETQGRATRPWTRVNVLGDHFSASATYDIWNAPDGYRGLTSGTHFFLDTSRVQVDAQTNWSFRQDTVQLVVGGSATNEHNSTAGPTSPESFLIGPISHSREALFGQGAWDITDQVKVVLVGRGDWSSLHDFQVSPRASVVYSAVPDQSVHFTFSRAFQAPNTVGYFLETPGGQPPQSADLSGLNGLCGLFGTDCGFGITPILLLGNLDLDVESIRTWEVGYKGVLAGRAFFTLDYYQSGANNIVTSLLPQVGTPLGRINPRFGPWSGPPGTPAALEAIIRGIPELALLSNNTDGSNIIAAASFTNFGQVDSQGIDVALNYFCRGPSWAGDSAAPSPTPGSTTKSRNSCLTATICCCPTRPPMRSPSVWRTTRHRSVPASTCGGSRPFGGATGSSSGTSRRTPRSIWRRSTRSRMRSV